MELETIVKAIFIGLVLLLHLPDHPKSRVFYSKNESGVGSHKNPLSLPKSRLIPTLDPYTFNENNIGYWNKTVLENVKKVQSIFSI